MQAMHLFIKITMYGIHSKLYLVIWWVSSAPRTNNNNFLSVNFHVIKIT